MLLLSWHTEISGLTDRLTDIAQQMIGFRNIAVHEYSEINLDMVTDVACNRLEDFEELGTAFSTATVDRE